MSEESNGEELSPLEKFIQDTRTELEQVGNGLREIGLLVEQSQGEVDKLAQRNAQITSKLHQIQAQFDEALQELRFGEFEQGKAQLLNVIQNYPNTSQAEDAYVAIADTYRQRQNNPDEALRYYQIFTEEYPESSRVGLVQLKMGFSYEDMEDLSSAEEMYRLVLKRHGEKSRLGQLANERLQSLKER